MQSCRAESSAPLSPCTHSSSVARLPWVLLGLKEAFLLCVCKWMHLVNKDWLPGETEGEGHKYTTQSPSPLLLTHLDGGDGLGME